MVDSTNPRIMADNIKELDKKIIAADVNANPTGEATGTLTKLEVDGTIYAIPQGTSVTANPEGAATSELTKIGVGTSIFSISNLHVISGTVSTGTGETSSNNVVFDNAMPDTNYIITANVEEGGAGWASFGILIDSKTVNGFRISTYSAVTHDSATIRYYVIY